MPKNVNPRKIPCTGADVKKAYIEGIEIGIRQAIKCTLYILLDKHQAPVEDVRQLSEELSWLAQRINEGRISWGFVDYVLRENHVEVRLK